MKTTLNEILKKQPCESGWEKLLKSLGKSEADDEPLSFKHILESNGIEDAVWALRVLDYDDRCLFSADVAESVLHIYEARHNDDRPRKAIEAVRSYKSGSIDKEKLDAAYACASTASYAASTASYAASTASTAAYAASTASTAAYAAYADADAASTASTAAYAAYADADAAYAAYADADAASTASTAAYAAYADADAAYAAYADADADADVSRKSKWQEIEGLFIKHFCGGEND